MLGLFSPVSYGIAALALAGFVWGHGYMQGRDGRSAAVAAEKASCEVKIANMETSLERTIADILSSVDESGPASKDVAQYCERHPALCRGEK